MRISNKYVTSPRLTQIDFKSQEVGSVLNLLTCELGIAIFFSYSQYHNITITDIRENGRKKVLNDCNFSRK